MVEGNEKLLSAPRQIALVLVRTLIGWHFLYEGYYKWASPGWGSDGRPLADWSAAGYLKAATGPLAGVFHWLAAQSWLNWLDGIIIFGLILVGVSLLLGLLTQVGCWAGLGFLSLFYLSAIPLSGLPQPGTEGTYLLVNKNLIELGALLVVLTFRTGTIAGLDLLLSQRTRKPAVKAQAAAGVGQQV